MLFWIFAILFALSIIGVCIFKYVVPYYYKYSDLKSFCINMAITSGTIFAVLLFVISMVHIVAPRDIAEHQVTYESLSYQMESNMYDNDNDIGKKELLDQVTEYNIDVQKHKALQRNFWVGIFYPNIWDQFETIPLEVQKGE